ncbi:hypothetical protein L6475_11210 [Prevotella sp. E9-3]|uniref:tetratricopeptide repeat protein n=1 Tax=Prevotella sp. E9-3 TaxID=2913621 RepID=UPI001EDB31E4|nr:hypothetical protein [Prevotella sp. E9-3]UKK47776.1 hypothetical protein L6475_11210 [Prevotella sp. E9-3]
MKYFILLSLALCATTTSWSQEEEPANVFLCKGDSLMNSYNTYEALSYYEQAFKQNDCAMTRMKLANCFFQRVAYQQTINLLKVMNEDSLSHEAFRQLVFSYHKLSNIPSMVYWAEQTVNRYPMDAEIVAKLISGFSQLNQPQNGVECALKYVEVDSTSIEVNRALENAYFMDFQFEKATVIGERLLALGDSVFTTFFLTGLSYSKLDSLQQAHSLLLKAATINDFKNDACVSRLGTVCLKMGLYEEGLKYLEMAKELIYPDTMQMRSFTLSLAEANYKTEHYQEAVDAWLQHIAYNPNTVVTYYNIANVYAYLLEDYDKAKKYYKKFMERAKEEKTPTPQLLDMIERAENMTRELPQEGQEDFKLPVDEHLKKDSILNDSISNDVFSTDSIKVEL